MVPRSTLTVTVVKLTTSAVKVPNVLAPSAIEKRFPIRGSPVGSPVIAVIFAPIVPDWAAAAMWNWTLKVAD